MLFGIAQLEHRWQVPGIATMYVQGNAATTGYGMASKAKSDWIQT